MTDPTPQPISGAGQPRWREDENGEWGGDPDLMRDAAKWIRSWHGNHREGESTYASMLTARGVIGSFVTEYEALVRDHAAVTQERDALRAALEKTHARQITDALNDHAALETENARLWEFVRAYDAWVYAADIGVEYEMPARSGLDAARAAMGDTP